MPDHVVKALLDKFKFIYQGSGLPDDVIVIKELERHFLEDRDMLTGALTSFKFRSDLFQFVLGNQDKHESKRFLCIDIEDVMSHNDIYGFAETDTMIINVAKYVGELFPKSKAYRYSGDKFVIDLVEEFLGIQQTFARRIKHAFVEISLCRRGRKHFKIVDSICLAIDKAMLESSEIGHVEKYEFIGVV